MAYTPVTPAQFKQFKPQFEGVDDAVVQMYLTMAGFVGADESWPEDIYPYAIMSMACHLMTLDGLGSDAESKAEANGTAQYQTVKSADLTLTRYAREAGGSSYQQWLNQTKCGQFYYTLLEGAKSGPRVVTVSGYCPSGYAKDWPGPAYGWPGVFGGC